MKKYKKSILAITVVSVFLLLSAVTVGSTTVNKEAYVVVSEKAPVSSGPFDNFSFNGSILTFVINILYKINDTINNVTAFVEVFTTIIGTLINALETIRDGIIAE